MCGSVYNLLEPPLYKSLCEGILWFLQEIDVDVPYYDLRPRFIQEWEYIFCEQLDFSITTESVDINQVKLIK